MDFNKYQRAAWETEVISHSVMTIHERGDFEDTIILSYLALKLNGEAGEVAELVGKSIRDDYSFYTDGELLTKIVKELGDVLWYVSGIATILGIDLSTVADHNLEKLHKRLLENKLHGSGSDR
jgi:NTP pyrophosphatase (non-canonical NTP hydrolase)